jgi:ferric-dicitrate binding protein FerR (iron transport regulator)
VSALEQPSAEQRRRRARRRWPRVLALLLGAVVMFALGVSLGMAIRDDPEPGGTVTYIRTLEPLPQRPASIP